MLLLQADKATSKPHEKNMIEYKFRHASAFSNENWQKLPQWNHILFNFDRYRYRIFNVEYESDNTEFRNALNAFNTWMKLAK